MSELKARPVERSGEAAYPTKREVLARPKLLERYMPSAWRARAELLGAAGLLLAANMAGCGAPAASGVSEEPGRNPETSMSPRKPVREKTSPKQLTEDAQAIVAPVFEHGNGRALMGCVAVTAPAFLSEEEALQIITEELAQHGLDFKERDVLLGDVEILRQQGGLGYGVGGSKEIRLVKPLSVDLYDKAHKVAIEFVGSMDHRDLGADSIIGTVWTYDHAQAARDLSRSVQASLKGFRFGTFYDPAVAWSYRAGDDGDLEKTEEQAIAKSKEQLRAQVQDFVEWLKAQGVL